MKPKAYLREPLLIMAVGNRVREYRQLSGLSQEELADRAGIAVSQVGRIERGQLNLSVCTLSALARALGVSPKDLLDTEKKIRKSGSGRK